MSFGSIEGDFVYQTTGQPLPADIQSILQTLLNENTQTAYNKILDLKTRKGLALDSILREVHQYVLRVDMGKDELVLIQMISNLADIEKNLANGTSERLQLGGLVAAFQLARNSPGVFAK